MIQPPVEVLQALNDNFGLSIDDEPSGDTTRRVNMNVHSADEGKDPAILRPHRWTMRRRSACHLGSGETAVLIKDNDTTTDSDITAKREEEERKRRRGDNRSPEVHNSSYACLCVLHGLVLGDKRRSSDQSIGGTHKHETVNKARLDNNNSNFDSNVAYVSVSANDEERVVTVAGQGRLIQLLSGRSQKAARLGAAMLPLRILLVRAHLNGYSQPTEISPANPAVTFAREAVDAIAFGQHLFDDPRTECTNIPVCGTAINHHHHRSPCSFCKDEDGDDVHVNAHTKNENDSDVVSNGKGCRCMWWLVSIAAPAPNGSLGTVGSITIEDLMALLSACRRYLDHDDALGPLPMHGNWSSYAFAFFSTKAVTGSADELRPTKQWVITDFCITSSSEDTIWGNDKQVRGTHEQLHEEALRREAELTGMRNALLSAFGCIELIERSEARPSTLGVVKVWEASSNRNRLAGDNAVDDLRSSSSSFPALLSAGSIASLIEDALGPAPSLRYPTYGPPAPWPAPVEAFQRFISHSPLSPAPSFPFPPNPNPNPNPSRRSLVRSLPSHGLVRKGGGEGEGIARCGHAFYHSGDPRPSSHSQSPRRGGDEGTMTTQRRVNKKMNQVEANENAGTGEGLTVSTLLRQRLPVSRLQHEGWIDHRSAEREIGQVAATLAADDETAHILYKNLPAPSVAGVVVRNNCVGDEGLSSTITKGNGPTEDTGSIEGRDPNKDAPLPLVGPYHERFYFLLERGIPPSDDLTTLPPPTGNAHATTACSYSSENILPRRSLHTNTNNGTATAVKEKALPTAAQDGNNGRTLRGFVGLADTTTASDDTFGFEHRSDESPFVLQKEKKTECCECCCSP